MLLVLMQRPVTIALEHMIFYGRGQGGGEEGGICTSLRMVMLPPRPISRTDSQTNLEAICITTFQPYKCPWCI